MTWSFAVILDAGSSGTRLYMYKWKKCDGATNPWQLHVKQLEPWRPKPNPGGISKLVREEDMDGLQGRVNEYLGPFVTQALSRIENVPAKDVPLFLLATAGVRGIEPAARRNALIQCMKDCPALSSFDKKECGTITGEQEALFGWLSAAYLRNSPKLGYVEMGGASAQIAFPMSAEDVAHYEGQTEERDTKVVKVKIGPWNSAMILVSYPFGLNEARNKYNDHLIANGESREGVILDPSKPNWYTYDRGNRQFRGAATDEEGNPTRKLAYAVRDIFAPCALTIGNVLVGISCKLDFVAGAGFWHSMKGAVIDDLPFVFQDYYRSLLQLRTQPSTPVTRAQMQYDPLFNVFWIMWVLQYSFGIKTTDKMADIEELKKKIRDAKKKAKDKKAMADAIEAEAKVARERASAAGATAEAEGAAQEANEAADTAAAAAASAKADADTTAAAAAKLEERSVEFIPYDGAGGIEMSWTLGQLIYFAGNGECDPNLAD